MPFKSCEDFQFHIRDMAMRRLDALAPPSWLAHSTIMIARPKLINMQLDKSHFKYD